MRVRWKHSYLKHGFVDLNRDAVEENIKFVVVIMVSVQNVQRKSLGPDGLERQNLVKVYPKIAINNFGKPVMKQYQRFYYSIKGSDFEPRRTAG